MSDVAKDGPRIRNTRILGREDLHAALEVAVRIGAESSGSSTLGMQFGWAWALELDDWKVKTVGWEDVLPKVRDAEEVGHGILGDDDLNLHIGPDIIEFCHYGDIDLAVTPITLGGIAICAYLEAFLPPSV